MKKWVLVGTLLVFHATLSTGTGVVEQADAMPPTPFEDGRLTS